MQKMKHSLLPLACILLALACSPVYAHGARLDYTTQTRTVTAVDIHATFDSGDPMSGAQVVIYAPDDPVNPWQTGVCDEQGRFSFTPDPAISGTWEIQARQSGHGAIAYVEIGEMAEQPASDVAHSQVVTGSTSTFTPLQYTLMGASVIWGLVGTALYFSGRTKQNKPQTDAHR